MVDVIVGDFLLWQDADTTGIVGALGIIAILWYSNETDIITDNDDLKITDQDDVLLLEKRAAGETDGIELIFPTPVKVNGLKIPEMDGGELYIWVDPGVYSQA